jgi:hypothetical protein
MRANPLSAYGPTPPELTAALHADALLDRHLEILTDAVAEHLAAAHATAHDPELAFQSGAKIGHAVQLAKASAKLVVAKARLRGDVQVRYHVVRVSGEEAARLALAGEDSRAPYAPPPPPAPEPSAPAHEQPPVAASHPIAAKNEGGGPPLNHEVQFGERPSGKRGAPLGNSNRLTHGGWSKAFLAERRAVNALTRTARHLIIRANMVIRARRAFLALVKKRAKAIAGITQLLRGPWVLSEESRRQLARQLSMLTRIAVHDTG